MTDSTNINKNPTSDAAACVDGNAEDVLVFESRQGMVHAIRQPLQSSMAWVDVCRQHLTKGNVAAAEESLARIAMLIEKCDAVAVNLINERLVGEP